MHKYTIHCKSVGIQCSPTSINITQKYSIYGDFITRRKDENLSLQYYCITFGNSVLYVYSSVYRMSPNCIFVDMYVQIIYCH